MTGILTESAPSDWQAIKIGQLFEQRSEKVSDEDYEPLSVTYKGVVPQLQHVAKSDDRENRKRVAQGDLVINSRSDRRGASGLSDYDGSVSLINIVLKPRSKKSRYFHYLFRSVAFQEEFFRFGHGIVDDLWTTRFSELKNIWVSIPPEPTQNRIAEYLDRKSQEFDHIINLKQRQISILREKEEAIALGKIRIDDGPAHKLKPTGLQWMPHMPATWQLLRAKYIYQQVSRPPQDSDEVVTAFRDGEVTLRRNRRKTGYTFAVKETGYQRILPGDLVIHTMDAFAGAVGVSVSAGKATGEYAVCAAINPEETSNEYYAEILRCMARQDYIVVLCPSVRERAPRFRFSKFAPVYLPVPLASEQQAIAKYLQFSRKARKSIGKSIGILEEQKASLITEAVQGRLDSITNQSLPSVNSIASLSFTTRVAAQIIYHHRNTQRFGRVKFQKTLYLAEAHAGISELQGEYERRAAGPLDQQLLNRLEAGLQDAELYAAQSAGSGEQVDYTPSANVGDQRDALKDELADRADGFYHILDKLTDLSTKSAEAVATLYAVWNDALIDGETPDDTRIIHGVFEEWHPEKKEKFRKDELETWLGWMRRNGFTPKGTGPRTTLGRLLV